MSTASPFEVAERYIQLRSKYVPQTWGDTVLRVQDMILAPCIVIVLTVLGQGDITMLLSTLYRTYQSWAEWFELTTLRFEVQSMYLTAMKTGGPFITTNDPFYMPYVWADAEVRLRTGLLRETIRRR
jgi:hypothetical protein